VSIHTTSVALTAHVAEQLRSHLDRPDGQEDICLVTYRPSTGATRRSGLITSVISPQRGERHVHGNASIEGDYVLRAATIAHARGDGLGLCHSHPGGSGWQQMSAPDWDAEASFANLVRELTGHPLIGITYAGADGSWSARQWDTGTGTDVEPTQCHNVRIIGDTLNVSWNDDLVPPPRSGATQRRSVSCWGPKVHADLTRRKVLVVGAGSVGLDVALRLAATGMTTVGVMDFDSVTIVDNLTGLTRVLDSKRSKYGPLDAPLVVAVQSNTDIPTHDYEVEQALFGVSSHRPPETAKGEGHLFEEGLWIGRSGWRNAEIPQVISIYDLAPWSVCRSQARCWSTLEPGIDLPPQPSWLAPMIIGAQAMPGRLTRGACTSGSRPTGPCRGTQTSTSRKTSSVINPVRTVACQRAPPSSLSSSLDRFTRDPTRFPEPPRSAGQGRIGHAEERRRPASDATYRRDCAPHPGPASGHAG
jgi:hypothetical protein